MIEKAEAIDTRLQNAVDLGISGMQSKNLLTHRP